MRYIVLRDCYVGDRYYEQGDISDLPDGLVKSPKNFQLVEGQIPDVVETEPPLYVSPKTKREK